MTGQAVTASRAATVVARVVVAVGLGYAAAAGLTAAVAIILTRVGVERSEAALTSFIFGLIAYLALLLWGFAARRLGVLALILAAIAVAGFGLVQLAGPGA